jgi:hypothetical protein
MLDGDKGNEPATLGAFGYFAAILLCCVIVGGLTYGLGREDERRYETPASYAKAAQADAQSACAGREGTAAFECIYEKVEAAQEQARGEQDLSAQQKAANSALLSTIIAFFTLVMTGVGVWFVKRTLEATLEAVEDTGKATLAMQEANRIAENQRRPWVSCKEFIIADLKTVKMEGERFFFYFSGFIVIENIGDSVASNFEFWITPLDVSSSYLRKGSANFDDKMSGSVHRKDGDYLAPKEIRKIPFEKRVDYRAVCQAQNHFCVEVFAAYEGGSPVRPLHTRQIWTVAKEFQFHKIVGWRTDTFRTNQSLLVETRLRNTVEMQ